MQTYDFITLALGGAAFLGLAISARIKATPWLRALLTGFAGAALALQIGEGWVALVLFGGGALLTLITWHIRSKPYAPAWIVALLALLAAVKLLPQFEIAQSLGAWLGLSYLIFRLIHVVVETRAGRIRDASLPEMFSYSMHPASLVAGPIDRLQNSVKAQRAASDWREDLLHGGWRILRGVFGKVVIANGLYVVVAAFDMPANPDRPVWAAWIWLLAFSFYLLADFAAYSDLAIGFGRLAGLRLPENFDKPYLAPSLTVFWQRWHMSLSSWLRDYIFFPLARSLRGRLPDTRKNLIQFIAHMTTMIACGLWHGLSGGFLAWGIWHGLGMFAFSQLGWGKPARKDEARWRAALIQAAQVSVTFLFVMLGWVFFAADFSTALMIFARLFGVA